LVKLKLSFAFKIFAIAISIVTLVLAIQANAQQLDNQDVDNSFGSTLSNSSLPIRQLTGGPYTIDNAGTIESTNGNTIRIDVDTTLNNTGLIDADVTTNGQTIQFFNNSGNNSLTNSGTIRIESAGAFSPAIKVQASTVSSITNTATGTIQSSGATTVAEGIRVDGTGSSVNLISNQGNISATGAAGARGISVLGDSASINQINNSGSITAQGGTGVTNGIVFFGGGTSVVNSGSITGTATDQVANGIRFARDLTTLNNSGTISGSQHGVSVGGTLTNIVNTGTISGTNGFDISNQGTIINLTNSQNNLTFRDNIPSNYFVLINNTANYGKVTFSNPEGIMNFAIADESTIEGGTYTAVLDGLSVEHLSGTSGLQKIGSEDFGYKLHNSVGSQWDLEIRPLSEDTNCTLNSRGTGCNKSNCVTSLIEKGLNAVTGANFAHMNTYDCDTFGRSGSCLSLGARHTSINDPRSDTTGLVLVFGKKITDHLRFGTFIHSNMAYNTPANYSLSNKTPLIGLYAVWNEHKDQTGLQLKVGTSYQAVEATILREQLGFSEAAIGNTVITAQDVIVELRNNIEMSQELIFTPYIAQRFSNKHQNEYTETGANLPLSYNSVFENSLTAIGGIKFKRKTARGNSFYGTIGVEQDILHDVSSLSPSGVSGITTVDLTKEHNATRAVLAVGFDLGITQNTMLRLKFQHQQLSYQDMTETNAYMSFNVSF
jgi:hypothetical protein